jgi:thiamine pyrophosphokinase
MLKIERTIDKIVEEQYVINAKTVNHEETIKRIEYDLTNAQMDFHKHLMSHSNEESKFY